MNRFVTLLMRTFARINMQNINEKLNNNNNINKYYKIIKYIIKN